jgi:protein involved in polysaccharide export with SLBB domain
MGLSPVFGLKRCMAVCLALAFSAGMVSAQPARSGSAPVSQLPGSKYYVWGQVRSPGAYSFIAAPDIFELLSAGGGPTESANLKQIVLIRAVTQKRTRVNLQAMLDSGQILRLAPGDVVIVPTSAWYSIREGLTIVTSVATLVTLAITILNWMGK